MTSLAQAILAWYALHARVLPWRGQNDPYAIWVSEIMLQQTRVETVIPYFERWMRQFPTLTSLAQAPLQQVLSAWEGLGYYSRARSLHRAAQQVQAEHEGQLPRSARELQNLPGIGRYTAAAIASIAFGENAAALDGNLKRIFARLLALPDPIDLPAAEETLWQAAQQNLPANRPGDYTQALMDLGASICLPRSPRCPDCPLQTHCLAFAQGLQNDLPRKTPPKSLPTRIKTAVIILQEGKTLLNQRPAHGLLGGLWEFPALEAQDPAVADFSKILLAVYRLKATPLTRLPTLRHSYTHFHLRQTPWLCRLQTLEADSPLIWVSLDALGERPMGKIDRLMANSLKTYARDYC